MEQLANLPMPALVTLGITIGIIFGVRYLGLWQGGKTSPASSPAAAQVAAVIVDPTALNGDTRALEAHTNELVNTRKSMERSIEKLCDAVDQLTDQANDLQKEMIRRGGQG